MALKPCYGSSKLKPLALSLIFLSLTLLFLTLNLRPKSQVPQNVTSNLGTIQIPRWYNVLTSHLNFKGDHEKMKIGLVNMNESQTFGGTGNDRLHGLAGVVAVHFNRVAEDYQWEDFFPEWIDEDEKGDPPTCPEIPMPRFEDYEQFDVVLASVPCEKSGGEERESVRDVFRLQVNLVVANLLVRSGWGDVDRTVYIVFVGSCGPVWEIFRCDDMLWHEGDYWVYKPDLGKLKQKLLMPVGTCQLASYAEPGQEVWRRNKHSTQNKPREAYVTVLHSSESYVCGAIALAQSIIRTNSTKDLILLADDSISPESKRGLKAAGWKIKHIERIQSPHARKGAYNEYNYSKLRIWQLIEYDKVLFIDSDIIVLKNIDKFFVHPQLSAVENDKFLFNSGLMLVEPSKCTFETLMGKRFKVGSYNGGDQGFLNEVFTWWHRWPSKLNHLKDFNIEVPNWKTEVPEDLYALHFLGLKPWMCYKDYDCNWDMVERHRFASDSAHIKWWQAYEAMPKRLQKYCGLTEGIDKRIRKWRGIAKEANLTDGHWKIKVKDPRRHSLI